MKLVLCVRIAKEVRLIIESAICTYLVCSPKLTSTSYHKCYLFLFLFLCSALLFSTIIMTKTIGIEYIIGNCCGYTFVEILKSVAIKLS